LANTCHSLVGSRMLIAYGTSGWWNDGLQACGVRFSRPRRLPSPPCRRLYTFIAPGWVSWRRWGNARRLAFIVRGQCQLR
jgi:hypothetical protein